MTDQNTVTEQPATDVAQPAVPVQSFPPSVPDRLSEVDRLSLELAKSARLTALAQAQTAIANNEKAELSYKYVVLQLYMKYGLNAADAIKESGEIVYGGALQQG